MADWKTCFNWMMDNEDAGRKYAIVPDVGGSAISGINSHSFPLQFAKIAAFPQPNRGLEVETFYRAEVWNKWFDQLASDDVAKRVFDMAVNGGSGTAVRLLQRACNGLAVGGSIIDEDGRWGPETLDAANSSYERGSIVGAFQNAREDHYEDIAAKN
ncbi:MAG TPA: putative peptidoglycan-binding domain-containing protein, partial [Terracidiphilus sp.]|nr:putative peptidoglycan-binding domain-containing protein [Terracidiphilus sp.]